MRLRIDGRQLQYADLQLLSADAPGDRSHDRRGEDSRADNRFLSAEVRRESFVRADHRRLQHSRMDDAVHRARTRRRLDGARCREMALESAVDTDAFELEARRAANV